MSIRMAVIFLIILVGCGSCATQASQAPFQWSQPSQGGNVSIKLIEHNRERRGAFTIVTYRMEAIGFPVEKPLELWTRHGGREQRAGWVFVDQQGTVRYQYAKSRKEVDLPHGELYIGEGREWAVFDNETHQVALAKVFPFPLVAEGPGGCQFSVELMSPDGMSFELTAEGFQENEELTFTSQSNGEVLRKGMKYPSSGPLRMSYLPGGFGKHSGEATVTFTGTRCAVSGKVNWGQAALVVQ